MISKNRILHPFLHVHRTLPQTDCTLDHTEVELLFNVPLLYLLNFISCICVTYSKLYFYFFFYFVRRILFFPQVFLLVGAQLLYNIVVVFAIH